MSKLEIPYSRDLREYTVVNSVLAEPLARDLDQVMRTQDERIAEIEAALLPFAKAVDCAGYRDGGPINIDAPSITKEQEEQIRGYPMIDHFIRAARVILNK